MADDLTSEVVEALHRRPDGWRAVVRDMAARHPARPARALEQALRDAADALDGQIRRNGDPTDEARIARRLALLLALDIDRLDGPDGAPTLGRLLDWWGAEDDFFLRL